MRQRQQGRQSRKGQNSENANKNKNRWRYNKGGATSCARIIERVRKLTVSGVIYRLVMAILRTLLYGSCIVNPSAPVPPKNVCVRDVTASSALVSWEIDKRADEASWVVFDPQKVEVQTRTRGRRSSPAATNLSEWRDVDSSLFVKNRSVILANLQTEEWIDVRLRTKNSRRVSDWVRLDVVSSSSPCPRRPTSGSSDRCFRTLQIPRQRGGRYEGGDTSLSYTWNQSASAIIVRIQFSPGTTAQNVRLSYTPAQLSVLRLGERDGNRLLEGTFFKRVRMDSPPWTIEDAVLTLCLDKVEHANRTSEFWPCVLLNHPHIDLRYLSESFALSGVRGLERGAASSNKSGVLVDEGVVGDDEDDFLFE